MSRCYQSCCTGEDERVETVVFNATIVTARKPHRCLCGEAIQPGDRYIRQAGLVDGDIYTAKIRLTCTEGLY